MSWFGSNTVTIDAQIERATDESIPFGETDLATSLEITDLIRSKQVLPKDAMRSLKKRLKSTKNPNTQLSTLHLIDTCVKNGGNHFIVEISSREFIDTIVSLIHDDKTNENVRDLALDLIQNWAIAFKENFQFKYVVSTYDHLKSDGYSFPSIGSEISSKLFDSSAPPEWEDSDACMICSTLFSMLNRKHHCRNCGGVFCQTHSAKSSPLPHLGITEPVRVCDTCYDDLSSKNKSHKSKKHRRSKHQKEVSRARAQYDSDDDDDLKKALELSLRESQGYTQVPIPFVPPPKQEPVKAAAPAVDEEDDDDMKAAIAASLKDLEDKKAQQVAPPAQDNSPYANLLPQSSALYQSTNSYPNVSSSSVARTNFINSKDEADIRQFASKVDYYKTTPSAANNPTELHELYRKAIPLTPKLSTDLNDSIDKYDKFVDLNSKIDTIMRLYNKMLDERIERESTYQRQYQQPQYGQQQQASQNAPYQQTLQQHYPSQSYHQQEPPQSTSPEAYYRAPSQIPQYNSVVPQQVSQTQSQSPYQQRQSITSVQSPIVAPQQPQYSGVYQPPISQQQVPQEQQHQENPPAYSNGNSYSYPPQASYQQSEDPFEEPYEEEDEFTAPPPAQEEQSGEAEEQKVYEPTPQHVVQPEFTGSSAQSYTTTQQPIQSTPYPANTLNNHKQTSPQLYNRAPQGYQYGGQAPYQSKVTEVTFPTVPLNRPPPTAVQQQQQQQQHPVPSENVKEEQLIEL